jgi:hypothetical protein
MRASLTKYIFISSAVIFCMAGPCFAETTTIKYAIENGVKLDGKKIAVEGEAIGHLMQRGEFAWLNINDTTEGIGVWASYADLTQIRNLGKHAVTGDWIRIYGAFNNRCPAHGGDTDIHAASLVLVKKGGPRNFPYDQRKASVVILLIGVLACLYIIKILKRRR